MREKNIGFILSRNKHAGNCRDARSKRCRLGHIGIPLYDELKTCVLEAIDQSERKIIFAVHCRAHKEFDFDEIARILGCKTGTIKHLSEDILAQHFDMVFGTVNPFLLAVHSNENLIQLFDSNIVEEIKKYPGTMMTNAGEHTWGIEFDPHDIARVLASNSLFSIARKDRAMDGNDLPPVASRPKSIGIITGNGPDSGITLWRQINDNIAYMLKDHFLGDISFPEIHIASIPAMGLSMELSKRHDVVFEAIKKATEIFKNQCVDILALACNTTSVFQREIESIFNGEGRKFISISDVVLEYINENNINNFALLGIDYVTSLGQWSAYAHLKKFQVETLNTLVMKEFYEISYNVKKKGDYHREFLKFTKLLNKHVHSANVIIASTELSVLLESIRNKHKNSSKNIIDALTLYSKKIAEVSLDAK